MHSSSRFSCNLVLWRSLCRGRSAPASSSSPLSGPRLPSFTHGRPYGKRSSSSSRSGGRKRFWGGKGGAPSSGPSGFRKWEPSPFRTLSGGCLSLHWQAWRDRGAEPWVVEVLRVGYCLPFLCAPPLSNVPIPMPSYSPTSIMEGCSGGGPLGLHCQGCYGACSTPFSRLLQPSVRSVEDLGVMVSGHRPLPSQSLCGRVSLPDGDLSVCAPVGASGGLDGLHRSPGSVSSSAGSSSFSSLSSLHFFQDTVYQFKALCFGLSTAPQVFTRVMAPVSAILHSMGIRMRRYLDDWLVQSPSRESLLGDLPTVLQLCHKLGIVVNPQKSNLVPSRVVQYLGVVIDSTSFRASPSEERISRLQSIAAEFQSCASPTASLWLSLLGVFSSLAHLVPGGRLRMRSLQLCLHRSWDRQDLEAPVYASMECLRDLQWWLHLPRLSLGVSLCQVSPDLPSGQTPQTWGGVPISIVRSLQACGTPNRRRYP